MSTSGLSFLAAQEGVVLKAYPDPGSGGDPWTIGMGHTSRAGAPKVVRGMTITRADALRIAQQDLSGVFEPAIRAAVKVDLKPFEFDALSSFTFNIGVGGFTSSSVLRLLNKGDRAGAADALLAWTKASGHVLSGLIKRRHDERQLFLTGNYGGLLGAVPLNDNGETAGVMLVRGCAFPEAVRALQTDLCALGTKISIDGDFGDETVAAVRSFQAAAHLSVDGKAGPATRAAMAAALAESRIAPAIPMQPLPGAVITAVAA